MKYYQIRWAHIKDCRKASGKSLFRAWCFLNGSCDTCHKKVRRWCKFKSWFLGRWSKHVEKIITKQIDAAEEASKHFTMCRSEDDD